MFFILFAVSGLLFGSFFNVVIYRVPAGKSIAFPPSHCMSCGKPIKWHMNIPVLSYLFLKGRCAWCGAKLSIQYPLVELAAGLIFAWSYSSRGLSLAAVDLILFACTLLIITVIDFNEFIIPWEILIPAFAWRVFFNIKEGVILERSIAFAVFFALIWLIGFVGKKVYKKEVMGGGDVYYTAFLAFFVGLAGGVLLLLLAALSASVIGYTYAALKKKSPRDTMLPFGPFLSLGALIAYLWGSGLIVWYAELMRSGY